MDRRSLIDDDGEMTPTRENVNVFDDEFEADDYNVVADGYRPGQSHDREPRQDEEEMVRSVSAHYATSAVASAGPSRNSTRKSRSRENPFASPDDEEEDMPLRRTPSGNFAPAIAQRSLSSASSTHYAGSSTERYAADGPSHPYGMYPQGTVARTPSAATASTIRPTRQSSSRYAPGPQHPYSLYPQGVSDGLEDIEPVTQNLVPVGFGLSQPFQRRRGPDGEEQDILGVYGHTEQLPPYTRYPEDGPEKPLLIDVPAPPTALHSRPPVLGTDPGMSLMHTQLLPAQQSQQSMTDDSELQRQNSRLSRLSSHTHVGDQGESSDTSLLSKKSWREKSWSEKRKTKHFGVPCWWFMALTAAIVFVGAVVGGAVGGFAAGQKSGTQLTLKKVASSTLYDASLITTATGVPPATGTFPLSFGLPQETEASCLTNTADRPAWSCDLTPGEEIYISITFTDGAAGASLFVLPSDSNSTQLYYGAQVSNMNVSFSPFSYVKDKDDPDDGSAFYFQQEYNKLVMVQEEMIDVPGKKLKRDALERLPDWLVQKQVAMAGDKPWLCYWNNTIMEGFIYTNRPAVMLPTPTRLAPTTAKTSPPTTPYHPYSSSPAPTAATAPWSIYGANPGDEVTTTVQMATTTCTYTGIASEFPGWMHKHYPNYEHSVGSNEPPYTKAKRDDGDNDGDDSYLPFNYLVKIEERRQHGGPNPLCTQVQILYNGAWNPVADPETGQQRVITLEEIDPPYGYHRSAKRRRTLPGGCHCQWMSGE